MLICDGSREARGWNIIQHRPREGKKGGERGGGGGREREGGREMESWGKKSRGVTSEIGGEVRGCYK